MVTILDDGSLIQLIGFSLGVYKHKSEFYAKNFAIFEKVVNG